MRNPSSQPGAECATSKRALSPVRRQLVSLFQRWNFARIEGLVVRNGEPVLHPLPRVVREHKFGNENGPRPESRLDDFALKPQLIDLFCMFDDLGDGTIDVVVIKHGLPFSCEVAA